MCEVSGRTALTNAKRGSCIRIPPLIFRGHSTNSIVSRIKEIHVHSHNDYVYESWLQGQFI